MHALLLQVKIFGGYTRWAFDLPPPSADMPARMVLTTVDAAHRQSIAPHPGPVHINVQLREPLSPAQHPWPPEVLQVGFKMPFEMTHCNTCASSFSGYP